MQRDYFQKKKCFDMGSMMYVRQNLCLHDVLCSISCNLICNMTTFRITCFDILTPPRGHVVVCKEGICACMVLYVTFLLI